MPAEFLQLAEQALQCGPTVKVKAGTGVLVKGRAMVPGVIDIKAHVEE